MSPSRNILLVANYAPDVGYAWWLMEAFWKAAASEAAEHGAQAWVCYPQPGDVPHAILDAGIRPCFMNIHAGGASDVRTTTSWLRKNDISFMYLTDQRYFNPRYAAFRFAGVRRIMNHDHTPGDRPDVSGPKGLIKSARNHLPLMTADHWIAISPLMRQRAIRNGRIPASRVSVVQNGIRPVEPRPGAREEVRRMFDLDPATRIVVSVGRCHPYKRIDFLIDVARHFGRAFETSVPLAFLHLGDGPSLVEWRHEAEALPPDTPRVVFPGRRSDVRDILPGCDFALHPSRGEGFSLAILEYMSAGLVTLVPDVPSVSQAIEHDVSGVIYPSDSPQEAAAWLHELLNTPERMTAMGTAAKQRVTHEFTLDRTMDSFRRTIRSQLWEDSGKPASDRTVPSNAG
jgi:glycosyltransferase involved in cell wall biosynthesis